MAEKCGHWRGVNIKYRGVRLSITAALIIVMMILLLMVMVVDMKVVFTFNMSDHIKYMWIGV